MNTANQLKGLLCIEISGDGCAACVSLMPVLKRVVDARNDLTFLHLEVCEETRDLVEKWQITHVPTVLLTDDGEVFARCHGFQPEEILEIWIDAKIEEHKTKKV